MKPSYNIEIFPSDIDKKKIRNFKFGIFSLFHVSSPPHLMRHSVITRGRKEAYGEMVVYIESDKE